MDSSSSSRIHLYLAITLTLPDVEDLASNKQDLRERIIESVETGTTNYAERFPNLSIEVRFHWSIDRRYRHIFDLSTHLLRENGVYASSRRVEFPIGRVYDISFEADLDALFSSMIREILPDRTPNTESDLVQLDEFLSSERDTLLTAHSGRIDLAGTTASDEDIAPRVDAAALAIQDLIEATANSNLHATLRAFAQRYRTELGRLRSGEPGLSWYVVAQRIELYRFNYIAQSGHDPAEYPALEAGIGTLIDSVILATAMLAGILPEIARSQEHIRQYSGEQVDVRTALRELVNPSLSALSHKEGVLTLRAAAVTAEAAELNIGTTPDNAPEAVRVNATKVGLLRGFLGAMARLAVASTHQVAHLQENIRTKGVYDVSKEVVLCQEGARASCCTRDEGGPFGAVL
jgi:hypothetical protein